MSSTANEVWGSAVSLLTRSWTAALGSRGLRSVCVRGGPFAFHFLCVAVVEAGSHAGGFKLCFQERRLAACRVGGRAAPAFPTPGMQAQRGDLSPSRDCIL